MLELIKIALTKGYSIYKGVSINNKLKHGGGISLLLLFLFSNGTISKDIFELLVNVLPNLTWVDYLQFSGLLSLGYLIWLTKDILVAYKNKIVRKIDRD